MATSDSISTSGDVGVTGTELTSFGLLSTVEDEWLKMPLRSSLIDVGRLRLSWLVRDVRDGRRVEYTVLTGMTSPNSLIAVCSGSMFPVNLDVRPMSSSIFLSDTKCLISALRSSSSWSDLLAARFVSCFNSNALCWRSSRSDVARRLTSRSCLISSSSLVLKLDLASSNTFFNLFSALFISSANRFL